MDSQKAPLDIDKIQVMVQTEINFKKLEVVVYQGELHEKVVDPADIRSVLGKAVLPSECPGKANLAGVNLDGVVSTYLLKFLLRRFRD